VTEIAQPRRDNIKLAIGAILFTSCALSLGDAVIKQISAGFLLWQIFLVRSAIAIPVLVAIAMSRQQPVSLMPIALGWTAVRSMMLAVMWVAFYAALPHVALSVAAAVYYTLPLFITLFAAMFIGEKVGALGWLAVSIGFCGVLLILKPHGEDFNAYALLPLISAVLYALAMILTRTKCRDEQPLVLSLSLNAAFIAIGAVATLTIAVLQPSAASIEANPFLFGQWAAMGLNEWFVMGLLAASTLVGSIGAAIAYQAGPASVVSTYDFTYLAFATVWGLTFFAEFPDAVSVLGIMLIAAAGILAVRR
jgi:drug/metabolite transporter (DMT)-like permease